MNLIFSDFDGTLTIDGKLGVVFFDILELLKKQNKELVIVSGRSLSWGHFLLTHFPLNYCIMEGGGVIVYKDDEGMIQEENLISIHTVQALKVLTTNLVKAVPKTLLSADSFGRRADRAVEIYHMDDTDIGKVEDFLTQKGAHFSRSDVHLNYWLEDLSKARAVSHFLKNYFPNIKQTDCLYFGDAMNDESMFEYFDHTVGVSNISKILDKLTHKPSIVLQGKENEGALGVFNYFIETLSSPQE